MVYFYAVLGTAMMVGIMAVFEMGLSLTGQSLILKPRLDADYIEKVNELKDLDKTMYSLLYQENLIQGLDSLGSPTGEPLRGSDLCAQLLCRIRRNSGVICLGEDGLTGTPPPVDELSAVDESSSSPSGQWSDSCALALAHEYRWLIRPESQADSEYPYQLFSCSLKYEGLNPDLIKCNFESSS